MNDSQDISYVDWDEWRQYTVKETPKAVRINFCIGEQAVDRAYEINRCGAT